MDTENMVEMLPSSFLKIFKETYGAFSVAEAIALYNICKQAPKGDYCEAGSHKCKSAIVSALAFDNDCDFYLLEPEFADVNFLGEAQRAVLRLKQTYNNKNKFHFLAEYSTDFFKEDRKFAYVMIDSGDHGEELVQKERALIEDKIVSGGILAMHDLNNQFTAVRRMYDQLLNSGKYEPVHIDWPVILKHVAENNLEEGNNSWHQYPELRHAPNFVGALRRK